MSKTADFYDKLAGMYHLVYPDWERAIDWQSTVIDALIKARWPGARHLLDVSCGIGTQSLGLADIGYAMTGSDLSQKAVERAKLEARKRNLTIAFSVADMRNAFDHHQDQFDVVISFDNAVPHLLSDADLLKAFGQFYLATRPGGGCLVSVRDYDKEDPSVRQIKPYGIRDDGDTRWIGWQVWDPRPPHYQVSIYLTEDTGLDECRTHVVRTLYNPIAVAHLIQLLQSVGFQNVYRIDGEYFQPVIAATKPAQPVGAVDARH